jgi:hypothetical protein
MIEFFHRLMIETWSIFTDAAPYVIFGFLAAGVIKAIVPEDAVARHLGGRSTMAVIKASLFGIPLPLCSCGVIPAAIGLRKQGAGRGPSAAFLVSTPESGVDSIAITWALLDPVMTVIRPIAAFITGTLTGILINLLPEETTELDVEQNDCGCQSSCCESESQANAPLAKRMTAGVHYAFGELLKDIGGWLLIGVLVAGLVATLLPDDFFALLFEHSGCGSTGSQRIVTRGSSRLLAGRAGDQRRHLDCCCALLGKKGDHGLSGRNLLLLTFTRLADQRILRLGRYRYQPLGVAGRGPHCRRLAYPGGHSSTGPDCKSVLPLPRQNYLKVSS